MLIYISSAKKLIKNSYFVAVGNWYMVWMYMGRNTDIQIQKYRNDVDGKKSVRCVRPLGGILGVVWQKYKYRRWVKGGKR